MAFRWIAFALILCLSVKVHFWGIGSPDSVVFDEVHFGKYAEAYSYDHRRIFDVHPPHSKILIAVVGKWSGYLGGFTFDSIGKKFPPESKVARLRWAPAVWGTLIPLAGFLILIALGASTRAALVAGLFLILENGLLLQTRIIALDGCLILSSLASILSLVWSFRSRYPLFYILLSGMFAGLALGSKFTGLVIPVWCSAVLLFRTYNERRNVWDFISPLSVFYAGFTLVYLGGWYLHFQWLNLPGPSDLFYKMTGSFFTDFVNLHRVMLTANASITRGHQDGSVWWQWMFGQKPIFYWMPLQGEAGKNIYFTGNRVLYFLIPIGVAFVTVKTFLECFFKIKKGGPSQPWLVSLVVLFWMSWLPYAFIHRVLFLYHFLPTVTVGIILVCYYWDPIPKHMGQKLIIAWTAVGIALIGFLFALPQTFGS